MKHFTFLKSLLLLCALVVGSVSVWAETLTVDFEKAGSNYTDWEYDKLEFQKTNSNVSAHGGSYFGTTKQSNTSDVSYLKTKDKIASPTSIVFYISKQSTNTTTSSWKVEISSNGSSWTQVGDAIDAKSMNRGTWVEVTRSLTSYSNVYVRISYTGSTAVRCIDDVTLTYTYTPQNYWVATYKYNDGVTSDKEVHVDKTTEASSYVLEAAPSRENFDFLGWNDGTDNYDGGASYPLSSDKTFTAQWVYTGPCTKYNKSTKNDLATGAQYILVGKKSDVYYFAVDDIAASHLYFSGSDVTNANSEITDTKATIAEETPLILTLEETTEGWHLKNSTKKLGMSGNKQMNWDTGDITWELGGSETVPTFSATNGNSDYILLFNNSTTPPRFNGYTGTSTSVVNAYFYRLDDGKNVYTLLLDFNDGDVTEDAEHRVLEGATYTLTAPTRDGYAFTGWNTEENGTGINYPAGAYIMPADDAILYAQWIDEVEVTITANKYATFSSDYKLDFSNTGVKAYKATTNTNSSVHLEEVTVVPANTGVLLYSETADDYTIPVSTETASNMSGNKLVSTANGAHNVTAEEYEKAYVFGKLNDEVGFFKAAVGKTVAQGRCYLLLDNADAPFLSMIFDDGETTNINLNVNDNLNFDQNAPRYNMAGQRVSDSYKGIVIVNGKKVVRK